MDLAVGKMETDGRVGQRPDDKPEQTPLDLLAIGRLVAEGATVLLITVLHVGDADEFVAPGVDDEDALAGEAASLEGTGDEDHGSLIH
jgi:hypothetical protein